MNPLVHHLNQLTNRPNPHVRARTRTRELIDSMCPKLRCPWSSRSTPRASVPHDSTIFSSLSHFAKVSTIFWFCSVILLQCQLFCYNELSHSATMNSIIFSTALNHFFYCCSAGLFFIPTVLSHCFLIQCSTISRYYSAQLFSTVIVLSHSSRSDVHSFLVAIMLSHFSLQKMLSHFSVIQY
jgi:hypothetical protein